MMGVFFVSRSLSVSLRSNTIVLPGGNDGESNSRVRTVSYNKKNDEYDLSKHEHCKLALGPLLLPSESFPGTMPREAFQRAKLSSSASSLAYSSADLATPG